MIATLVLALVVGQADVSPKAKAYSEQAERQRQEAIEAKLKSLKHISGLLDDARKRRDKRSIDRLRDDIKQTNRELGMLRKNSPAFKPFIDVSNMRVGEMGQLQFPDNVSGDTRRAFKVLQVIGDVELVVEIFGKPVCVKGVSTKNVTDGATVGLNDEYEVTGTKRFQKASGGTKTIFVLEPLPDLLPKGK